MNNWRKVRLEEITTLITKGTTPTTYGYNFVEEGINFLKIENLNNDNNLLKITPECHEKLKRSQLEENDILFSIAGSLGNTYIVKKDILPCNTNQALAIIRLQDNVDKDYINYFLNGPTITKVINGLKTVGAQPNLSLKQLGGFNIDLPSLKEQQKIAEILSSVDVAIEKTEQVIAKTEELKKGLMQQLLTKGIGHTEFKQTEIGEIPVEWQVNEIGTLIKVQGGYAFKSKDAVDFGVRWFKIANVSIGNIKWEDVSYLPNNYTEIYQDYLLEEGDFVIALTRPILKNELKIAQINKNDIPALLNQRVGRIRYKKEVNPQFIYYVMTSKYYVDEINSRILGTDPPNVSPKQLESILIQIPSIEEQSVIAAILENVDKKIKKEKDTLFKFNKIKQGLMQQLLTGQTRVKVD